jgi:DNA-binding MarR family transcriptional regulator
MRRLRPATSSDGNRVRDATSVYAPRTYRTHRGHPVTASPVLPEQVAGSATQIAETRDGERSRVSDMPGLGGAELQAWQHFFRAAMQVSDVLNREVIARHTLTLMDVILLDFLAKSPTGSARMGELATVLTALPSRASQQVGRLESQGLVRRGASEVDRRGVEAYITNSGRAAVKAALVTYAKGVRAYFLSPLSRSQMIVMGDGCRRIGDALAAPGPPAKPGRR